MPAFELNARRAISALALVTLVGCGGSTPPDAPKSAQKPAAGQTTTAAATPAKPAAPAIDPAVAKSPSLTVQTAYMAAAKGNFDLADKFLSASAYKTMSDAPEGAETEGTKPYWSAMTRDGKLEKVEIAHEEVKDGQAVILVELHYGGENQLFTQEVLVQEGGSWKIQPTIEEPPVQQAQKD